MPFAKPELYFKVMYWVQSFLFFRIYEYLGPWLKYWVKYVRGGLFFIKWAFRLNYVFKKCAVCIRFSTLCLVLLCGQNSFGRSKMVLVWPNWFGLDHNDLVMTKMKWSWPKWIGQVQIWFILVENHDLDLTNSFWLWPFRFGRDQIIMVKSKSIWADQNHFGSTKTVLVT